MYQYPLRTITLGLADTHPIAPATIQQSSAILREARTRYIEAGYEVQSVRLSTRPLFADLASWSDTAILRYTQTLQGILDDVGLTFCSLGTADVTRIEFPLERLALIPAILASTSALSTTVQLATVESGLRTEAALPTAQIMQRLAIETAEGFGNFRFAMLACVAAGCPFFPTAYHAGPSNLSLGLQGAGIVSHALRNIAPVTEQVPNLPEVTKLVREALRAYATPVVEMGKQIARDANLQFGGIDLSPAPMGDDSIVPALEMGGSIPLGTPGTLAMVSALTAALQSTGLPTCGYCGIMLPVLEDRELGRRWEEGRINVHQLLLYSAVCGTGLDTIPLAGDSPTVGIAQLLLDVAALALRWQKPLSARLFPVPGKCEGERTTFTSPYLVNTTI